MLKNCLQTTSSERAKLKIKKKEPVRIFTVGHKDREITLSHMADISLKADEQVTFVSEGGHELDVVRKPWGYYATSSLNGRLVEKGFRSALVGSLGRKYVLLVENESLTEFMDYIEEQGMSIIEWLDDVEE